MVKWMASRAWALGCLTVGGPLWGAGAPEPGKDPSRYDVVWTEPGRGPQDSMPLGNGDIGLNVWVEPDGDVLFYIAKTDAWSETGQLLKLGRIRLSVAPLPGGSPFRQALELREATVRISQGGLGEQVQWAIWVNANHPVVCMEMESDRPVTARANVELWREGEKTESPAAGGLVWYHRNETSHFVSRLQAHHLDGLEKTYPDPLLGRTFGGWLTGPGRAGEAGLPSLTAEGVRGCSWQIHILTAQTASGDEWRFRLEAQARRYQAVLDSRHRAEHVRWWEGFWGRSWIHVESDRPIPASGWITATGKPLRIGADDQGGNRYRGRLARVTLFARPLRSEEIVVLAASVEASRPADGSTLGDWRFAGGLTDGVVPDLSGAERHGVPHGTLEFGEFDGVASAQFSGEEWVEVPNDEALDQPSALTVAAWVAPDQLGPGGARILDKGAAGTDEGYVFDTFPGNSLRLILKAGTVRREAVLPVGRWSHVAALVDPERGVKELYLNGQCVVSQPVPRLVAGYEGQVLSRAYALQRFIAACAGRGAYPIKFNGSLFTVDWPEPQSAGNPDSRAWGPDYWHQNTRLIYWPMLAAGDWEMMLPFFRMYVETLPLQKERTCRYFGHDGAYFPETMSFWGLSRDEDYGVGAVREGQPLSWHANGYIRRHWQGGLETGALMLDYQAYTDDQEFLTDTLLPYIREVLTFYDCHYPREAGKIRFEPAQALETWWDCVDPLPEIAGLRFVLDRLLALPEGVIPAEDRERWVRLAQELPDLPTWEREGKTLLAPARQFATLRNCENPELYAVFPYRLWGVGKEGLEMGRDTFAARRNRMGFGWSQDEIQMALLGLADQAGEGLVRRASTFYAQTRFPAFWGPNFDWIPDQDHGSVLLMALQLMLLQWHGDRLLLLPAWPARWDVHFRLHAPDRTTVEAVYRDGKIEFLEVQPERRKQDVTLMEP